ncbi:MAG: hypothetical protein NTY48_03635 [Candidatus Diapherotrites archaeon]|nr:hypothetical protein [Candidatus Diapherotrites archaeon]
MKKETSQTRRKVFFEKNNKSKGFIFSTDATIALVIMLTSTMMFTLTLAETSKNSKKQILDFELEENALLISDTLIKNHYEENPILGSAIIDYDKKRVLENKISLEELKKSKPIKLGEIFVSEIKVILKNRTENILFEQKQYGECISIKRFALIDEEKGIIEVKTCREKND